LTDDRKAKAFHVLTEDQIAPLSRLAAGLCGGAGAEDDGSKPIARRRLRRAAYAIHRGIDVKDRFSANNLLEKCEALSAKQLATLVPGLDRDRTVLMLENLWDYLNPLISDDADEDGSE
jgi:hypothetical protein